MPKIKMVTTTSGEIVAYFGKPITIEDYKALKKDVEKYNKAIGRNKLTNKK